MASFWLLSRDWRILVSHRFRCIEKGNTLASQMLFVGGSKWSVGEIKVAFPKEGRSNKYGNCVRHPVKKCPVRVTSPSRSNALPQRNHHPGTWRAQEGPLCNEVVRSFGDFIFLAYPFARPLSLRVCTSLRHQTVRCGFHIWKFSCLVACLSVQRFRPPRPSS